MTKELSGDWRNTETIIDAPGKDGTGIITQDPDVPFVPAVIPGFG